MIKKIFYIILGVIVFFIISFNLKPEFLTAISTFGLTIVTIFLSMFTYRLWKQTDSVIKQNKDNHEIQTRAYLSIDKFELICPFNNENYNNIGVTFVIKNHGATVAQNVKIYGKILLHEKDYIVNNDKQFEAPIFTQIVFPTTHTEEIIHGFDLLDKVGVREKIQNFLSPTPKFFFSFFGYIEYEDIFNKRKRTNFGYYIDSFKSVVRENGNGKVVLHNNQPHMKWWPIEGMNSIT